MKIIEKVKNQKGFTLAEIIVSMGLLTFVIMISLNIISMVVKTAKSVDCQVNVTQETNYAAERVRRLIRSADAESSIDIHADKLTFSVQGVPMALAFEIVEIDGDEETTEYVLKETIDGVIQSVMASNIYVTVFDNYPLFQVVYDNGDSVGVKVIFEAYDVHDKKKLSGGIVSTQAFNRSIILNKQ